MVRSPFFFLFAVTLVACGGQVAPDDPRDRATPDNQQAITRARARCTGSAADMEPSLMSGIEATPENAARLLAGKWILCPTHTPQFHDELGIEVETSQVCALDVDTKGALVPRSPESACVPWHVTTTPFEGVQFGAIGSTPWFSPDEKLFLVCANPYCAVYSRLD